MYVPILVVPIVLLGGGLMALLWYRQRVRWEREKRLLRRLIRYMGPAGLRAVKR